METFDEAHWISLFSLFAGSKATQVCVRCCFFLVPRRPIYQVETRYQGVSAQCCAVGVVLLLLVRASVSVTAPASDDADDTRVCGIFPASEHATIVIVVQYFICRPLSTSDILVS